MSAPAVSRLVAHVGSLRAALAWIALLALVLAARLVTGTIDASALLLALGLLAVNLVAGLAAHPRLRRRMPLLVAHVALLGVAVAAGVGRMMSLEARFELTQGVPFDGVLLDRRAGPWHRDALSSIGFAHHGFEIDYAPGRKRGATRNAVSWHDDDGLEHRAVIGDHRPLVLAGHRIYTSSNKGFAPVLTWQPERGEVIAGSVHLPSFPAQELAQSRAWTLPDGREVWVQLEVDEALIDPARATGFRMPSTHRLIVRTGEQRAELVPGAALAMPGGTLRYEALRTWMGYRVAYDPALPWLLLASLVAALALAWHYAVPADARLPRPAPSPRQPASGEGVLDG